MLCTAITTADQWLWSFLISRTTPYMITSLGYGTYMFFGALMVLMGFWAFFFVPETKGTLCNIIGTNGALLTISYRSLTRRHGHSLLLEQVQDCLAVVSRETEHGRHPSGAQARTCRLRQEGGGPLGAGRISRSLSEAWISNPIVARTPATRLIYLPFLARLGHHLRLEASTATWYRRIYGGTLIELRDETKEK